MTTARDKRRSSSGGILRDDKDRFIENSGAYFKRLKWNIP